MIIKSTYKLELTNRAIDEQLRTTNGQPSFSSVRDDLSHKILKITYLKQLQLHYINPTNDSKSNINIKTFANEDDFAPLLEMNPPKTF